jgi:hypothetical protein
MGRGLSALQQQILVLAWEREQRPTRPGPSNVRGWLFPQEIYVRLYHWPITSPGFSWEREQGLAFRQAPHFSPSVIGAKRYRATMVAVSRALGRLCRRGLLTLRRKKYVLGWCLTAHGRTVAQALMVDNSDMPSVTKSTVRIDGHMSPP